MPATPRRARNFGGSSQHQKLMMANLAASLFAAEAIVTTEAKAKALRPIAEKLITKAKKATDDDPMRVHRIRQIQGYLGDREMTSKLVNDVAPRYSERNGGYLRILKLGPRQGDNAPMARIELVCEAVPDDGAQQTMFSDPGNEPVALRRVRFVVAYAGAGFRGFAINDGTTTVASALTEALGLVTRHPVVVVGAGRTDAGVHAWGQVVSCDVPAGVRLRDIVRRVNSMCGPQIVIRHAEWTDAEFSARFSAAWRQYRYTVLNSPEPNPFLAQVAWHVHRPLSLPAMQLACDPLIGENDFTSFCRKPKHITDPPADREPSMHRRVMFARWSDVSASMDAFANGQRVLRFEIRANAFCHQMVRSIVGTMVDIGLGKLHAGDVREMMRARDRRAATTLAPPHGLCLWEVGYRDGGLRW